MAETPDVRFWFDPVCPYCWLTSIWVRTVARRRDFTVEWRFIALRLLNAHVDYDAQFPPEYEAGHTAGLRLLRVCAAVREQYGPEALARLYEELGTAVFEREEVPEHSGGRERRGTHAFVVPVLEQAGLPGELAESLDDARHDATIQAETDEALALTGKDVGTPIIQLDPPDGLAFFGPVISRKVGDEQAEELWDHVVGLTRFPGFAELKRSLRERPQLAAYGVAQDEVGLTEDWHGGSRRQHR
jgi:2-hydroxychromene-2-carboxylate isomerase